MVESQARDGLYRPATSLNVNDLSVRRARRDELSLVLEILDQASDWLIKRGISQWESPSPPKVWKRMASEIEKGEVYLARERGSAEAFGTFRFEWAGAPLWPTEADTGYIHTMAIRPKYMGQQLGKKLLMWAIAHVRGRGKRFLRVDCMSSNWRLRNYYEAAGFLYRGDGKSGSYVLSLYELVL